MASQRLSWGFNHLASITSPLCFFVFMGIVISILITKRLRSVLEYMYVDSVFERPDAAGSATQVRYKVRFRFSRTLFTVR